MTVQAPMYHATGRLAKTYLRNFDWRNHDTNWHRRIPTQIAVPLGENNGDYGCGIAVASMILSYQPRPESGEQVILLQRRGDKHPGLAGGKIETLHSPASKNLDPTSCCMKEGEKEYGFNITPRALIGISMSPLEFTGRGYNSIVNYSFLATPENPRKVAHALENSFEHLEEKMERYVVEGTDTFRERIRQGRVRMPDNLGIGKMFYRSTPAELVNLTQFVDSGVI